MKLVYNEAFLIISKCIQAFPLRNLTYIHQDTFSKALMLSNHISNKVDLSSLFYSFAKSEST